MTDRAKLVSRVAAEGMRAWPQLTSNQAIEFVGHYIKYIDDEDLIERDPAELAALVSVHAELGRRRDPDEIKVEVRQPANAGDSTMLFAVLDDRVFIVDSISMALNDAGWAIRQLFHPQFQVARDASGALVSVTHRTVCHPDARAESWVCCEIFPPLGESSAAATETLVSRVRRALSDGSLAVADYSDMLVRVSDVQQVLRNEGVAIDPGGPIGLLNWLTDDNFTFLGFVEFNRDGDVLRPVPGSGLGIYTGERNLADEAVPLPTLFTLSKDPRRSSVHRPSYLDRISVRRLKDGETTGELRFVGLFTSNAYDEPVHDIPFLAAKADEILTRTGYALDAHGAKAIMTTLAAYPRDELLQASVDDLYKVVVPVSRLNERRTVRLYMRTSPDGRFITALVFFPRDRYNTQVRVGMQDVLRRAFHAVSVDYQARVGESSLARLYFVLALPEPIGADAVDAAALERELELVTRTWDDAFIALAAGFASEERGIEFSEGYREAFLPAEGVADLRVFNTLSEHNPIGFTMMPGTTDLRLKVYLLHGELTLSRVLPQLTALGVEVLDEWPYEINLRGHTAMLYDFSLRPVGFEVTAVDRDRFIDAFAAALQGQVEADSFSALVTKAGLRWGDAAVLRTIARYLRQTGSPFSQTYIARALVSNPSIARDLSALFDAKFDPGLTERDALIATLHARLAVSLDAIDALDIDRILRGYLAVIDATVRTNAFAADSPFVHGSSAALALKLHPSELAFVPSPKPKVEIYVYSPRVEGVHLRFSDVARGGLRWSDRAEDYRTEVLGLVKAQMVKNTVIVPAGAKGGFFAKQLPDPAVAPEAWRAEGIKAYQAFVTALLSVTDNIVAGEVVPPERVVCHDGLDPYLVVAADKGTATFSDIANAIAVERGFWLGDGFASGGSNGYDHKAMGITARGAWESVKRHFFEIGIDCQQTGFTCVGIGDMAGDVFGNGMLLSQHTQLIAAFNHRHIFLDPDPDAAVSWAERKRLFELPGSAWSDYDPALLSVGGGVYDRSAKAILVSTEAASALGVTPGRMTPDEVISAILRAPVDLLWNGGIGTYVKAQSESHAEVGDRANDLVRVNGNQVRAKIAGEGGNLGWTQAGRVEYARAGGRINTDFIDNSAGVDTSDHEVNIKILLAAPLSDGRLDADERTELLQQMTHDVARHVLAHNVDQNIALANARASAARYAGVHEGWITKLVTDGYLDRALEGLPDAAELSRRIDRGEGLFSPELATLLAWTKIWLVDQVLASDLPDDPFVAGRLSEYFPKALRARFAVDIERHRLRREIITTVAVNRFVNSQGISAYFQLAEATGASPADVFRAQLASRSIFAAGRFEVASRKIGLGAQAETELRLELRALVERGTRWLLQNRALPLPVQGAVDELGEGVRQVLAGLRHTLTLTGQTQYNDRVARLGLVDLGADTELIAVIAGAPVADRALSIADIASRQGLPLDSVARAFFALSEKLGFDVLGERIEALPQFVRWDSLARSALLADLGALRVQLLVRMFNETNGDEVDVWLAGLPHANEVLRLVSDVGASEPDLAKSSVALRAIRGLMG